MTIIEGLKSGAASTCALLTALYSVGCGGNPIEAEETLGTSQQDLQISKFSNWSQVQSGTFESGPAVTSRTTNQLDAFATGLDHKIYSHYWSPVTHWIGPTQLPGATTFASKPAATSFGSKLLVAARGTDNTIYANVASGSPLGWSGWQQVNATPFNKAPAAVYFSPYLYLFSVKSDQQVYRSRNNVTNGYNPASWSGWTAIPGGTVTSDPAAVVWGSKIQVAAKGGDNLYWTTQSSNGTSWGGFFQVPGASASTTFVGAPALSGWSGHLDIFGQSVGGGGGKIAFTSYNSATGWDGSYQFLSKNFATPIGAEPPGPAAWSFAQGHVDLLMVGDELEPPGDPLWIRTYQE